MRVTVTLACSECKQRNYTSTKNKKNDPDRIEMKKYCKFCKTHTAHGNKINAESYASGWNIRID